MDAPDGASVPWLVQALDADIRAVCQDARLGWIFVAHDADYTRGGSEADKLDADCELYWRMRASEVHPPICVAFFEAVRQFGRAHWRYPAPAPAVGPQAP